MLQGMISCTDEVMIYFTRHANNAISMVSEQGVLAGMEPQAALRVSTQVAEQLAGVLNAGAVSGLIDQSRLSHVELSTLFFPETINTTNAVSVFDLCEYLYEKSACGWSGGVFISDRSVCEIEEERGGRGGLIDSHPFERQGFVCTAHENGRTFNIRQTLYAESPLTQMDWRGSDLQRLALSANILSIFAKAFGFSVPEHRSLWLAHLFCYDFVVRLPAQGGEISIEALEGFFEALV